MCLSGVVRIPFSGPNGKRIRCVPPSPNENKSHLSRLGSEYNLTKPDYYVEYIQIRILLSYPNIMAYIRPMT